MNTSKQANNNPATGARPSRAVPFEASLLAAALCAALGAGVPARADEYHYNNVLIGDRASGMGGAYTAISDDPTGLYYNPAGIVYAHGNNLSASVNAFHSSTTTYKKALGGNDWKRESSTLLPNFFGVVQPLGGGMVGFSYAVPDSTLEDQDQTFTGLPSSLPGVTITRYVINFNNKDSTYNLGPSYAIKLSDNLSVGGTLYYHYRERETINNQLINLDTGQYQWSNTYYQTDEKGVRPILGLTWSPADRLALGLTLTTVYIRESKTTSQVTLKDITYDGNTVSRTVIQSTDKRDFPLSATVGAAWFASDKLLVSGDLAYHGKSEDVFVGKKEAVWNWALGAEYYMSANWAVRAGLYSNLANTPTVKSGGTNQPEHIDLYGGSASLSYFTGNSATTFGLSYSQGSGKTQLFGNDTSIQDTDRSALMLFLSASYTY